MDKITEFDLAEAQLIGYMMASKGHDIITLIEEMGITKQEWEKLRVMVNLKNTDIFSVDKHFGLI